MVRIGSATANTVIRSPTRWIATPLRDGVRFLLIIFKIGTLYSPLKLFLPVSLLLFVVATALYGYTYLRSHQFTNMSALLFTTSLLTFLIGLVSEQITNLMYQMKGR